MKLSALLTDLDYTLFQGSEETEITKLVYDSRKVVPGAVFLCISGTTVDAHTFIHDAIKKGAVALVVEKDVEVPDDITVIRVHSARYALACMAAAYFGNPAREMTTIGLTGTKGKTTTAHMIKKILETCGYKVGMMGTNGIFIGDERIPSVNTTPESYLVQKYMRKMVDSGCHYLVMEVSSQGLMMDRVSGFTFDYGLFTNISPDHMGPNEHKDFADYLYWKSRMLSHCRVGIVNRDDEHFDQIVRDHTCELRTFSMNGPADTRARDVRFVKEGKMLGTAFHVTGETDYEVRVNIPGLFNAVNALAAVAVLEDLKLPQDKVLYALEHIYVNGRMELVYASDKLTVIVDYAHNAVSMESLLKTLRDYHPARLVCVFGCGGNRSRIRRFEMGEIGGKLADLSVITADNSRFERTEDIIADILVGMKKTTGRYVEIPDRREAINYCVENAQEGDMVVIIGKGHEDYQEINGVRTHFSDREEAEKALAAHGYTEE